GGPTVLHPEETSSGDIVHLSVTPIALDGGIGSIVTSTNTVTITSPLVNFSVAGQSLDEGVINPEIEVTLSEADPNASNTVDYVVTGSAVGGGKDYTLANGTLTFVANDTSEMIPLVIVDDVLKETNETVVITLSSPSSKLALGSTTVHTYTITDNETMEVEISNGDPVVDTTASVVSSVNVNSTGDFTSGTEGAYRWTVNGANFMSLNLPFASEGLTETDFSGIGNNGAVNGATHLTTGCKVGDCRSFDGND